MRQHKWIFVGPQRGYLVERCKRCPMRRRHTIATSGPLTYEYLESGGEWSERKPVPACGATADVLPEKP